MASLIERRGYSRDGVFVLPEGWADAQELEDGERVNLKLKGVERG